MGNAWKHFCTITHHKNLCGCFLVDNWTIQAGARWMIFQNILRRNFWLGLEDYQGTMSPNNAERKEKGYSLAWLHHKGRNRHHLEYWIDYDISKEPGKEHSGMAGMKMPVCYGGGKCLFDTARAHPKTTRKTNTLTGVHSITICTADRII